MTDITSRKSQHIQIVAEGRGLQHSRATGFDAVHFQHDALPDLDFDEIRTDTRLLGRRLGAPLMVSAMTGGPVEAARINAHIAEACQHLRIALSVGSQRIAVEDGAAGGLGRDLRDRAPDIPILGNIGAVQLNYGFGPDQALRAVEMIGADALILHLNPLQEAIQPGGDRNFAGLLPRIEAERGPEALRRIAAPFHDWGIPTADALRMVAPVMAPIWRGRRPLPWPPPAPA